MKDVADGTAVPTLLAQGKQINHVQRVLRVRQGLEDKAA